MKKIFVVVQAKDQWPALEALREAGLVHVEPLQVASGSDLERNRKDIENLENALGVLREYECQESAPSHDWRKAVSEVSELKDRCGRLQEEMRSQRLLFDQYQPWGDFHPEDIGLLAQHGIQVKLYELTLREWRNFQKEKDVIVVAVNEGRDLIRVVAFGAKVFELPYRPVPLPAAALSDLKRRLKENEELLKKNEERLFELAQTKESLAQALQSLRREFHLHSAAAGMAREEGLVYLKGYVPGDRVQELQEFARAHQWGMLVEDPGDEDNPPTLIRNPRWIEIIKPVFNFMNSIPGYRELDVSLFFLLFLSIFFGILIGDAGYGILFIVGAALVQRKMRPKMPASLIYGLIYAMSAFAVVWGFLTGTFFGTKLFGIKPILPWLTFNENVQLVCFLLGAIHLSIAHIWRAINRINSVTALAEIGWTLIVWACFFFTRMLILNQPLPQGIIILLIAGPGLVILFNQPRKNILAGMGLGLGDFLLNVMSFFGDLVSYIRLFAVGLAGVSVADAFNQLALSAGFQKFPMALLALFVLLVGHALNMILAVFGVLVHGIRLNLLEFSSHLGMEWSGKEYDPLRK